MAIQRMRQVSRRGSALKFLIFLLMIAGAVFIVMRLQSQVATPIPAEQPSETTSGIPAAPSSAKPRAGVASPAVSNTPPNPAGPKNIFSDMTPGPGAHSPAGKQLQNSLKKEDPAFIAAKTKALEQSTAYTAQAAEAARLKTIWDAAEKNGSIQERLDAGAACNQAREKLKQIETQVLAADPAVAAAKSAAGGH